MSRRLEAETIDRLVAQYVDGTTAAEVDRRYGVANSSVLQLVRQAGRQVRQPRLSISQTAQLVALYQAGLSQKDIAARLDRSPSAIWHCLRRAGLVGRNSESSANWRVVLRHGGGLSLRMFRHHVDRQQRLCASRFGCEPTR